MGGRARHSPDRSRFTQQSLLIHSPSERDLSVKAAALIPVLTWGPTLAAMRAPGTSLDNPPTEVYPRLFGIPINLYVMEAPVLLAALGYWLDRRGRSPCSRRRRIL